MVGVVSINMYRYRSGNGTSDISILPATTTTVKEYSYVQDFVRSYQ
jgi:hypothetical protein